MDQPQTISVEYFDLRQGGWTVVKVAEKSPVWAILNAEDEENFTEEDRNIKQLYRKIEG